MKNERFKILFLFRISSLVHAVSYGFFTYFVIYKLIAGKNMFLTYLLNIALIVIVLFLDNVSHRWVNRKVELFRQLYHKEMGIIPRILFTIAIGFFRESAYIFYLITLILSRVSLLESNLFNYELSNFFISIEYGLILLIVFDKFKEQIVKNEQWFKEIFCVGISK
ncbi:MAG: hypothetical protein FWC34_00185 [Bacteroidetes bacterium]|nr:hypothetical protein [Bacteroidota bacterium]